MYAMILVGFRLLYRRRLCVQAPSPVRFVLLGRTLGSQVRSCRFRTRFNLLLFLTETQLATFSSDFLSAYLNLAPPSLF
jgi:hypothetical protein